MVSSNNVTITRNGSAVVDLPHFRQVVRREVVDALREHFIDRAERMPEDVQKLVDKARENVESAAQGAPDSQAARIRAGIADDPRLALIVRLARALEAAYSKGAVDDPR